MTIQSSLHSRVPERSVRPMFFLGRHRIRVQPTAQGLLCFLHKIKIRSSITGAVSHSLSIAPPSPRCKTTKGHHGQEQGTTRHSPTGNTGSNQVAARPVGCVGNVTKVTAWEAGAAKTDTFMLARLGCASQFCGRQCRDCNRAGSYVGELCLVEAKEIDYSGGTSRFNGAGERTSHLLRRVPCQNPRHSQSAPTWARVVSIQDGETGRG